MNWSEKDIITSLSYPGDHLPEDALHEAIRRYDRIRDELHAALKLSPDEIKYMEEAAGKSFKLKFYAMYLAAEQRDADTFPLIRDYFTTHGEQAWDSLGNTSTRDMARILASVCNGDAAALKFAVELDGMDSFARMSCLDALGILMCEGDLPRRKLLEWFRVWLRDDRLNQQEYGYLANICILLALKEFREDLLASLKSGRLDAEAITMGDIEDELPHAEISDFTRHLFSPVDDAVSLILECSLRGYLSILFTMFDRNDFDALMPFFQQNRETRVAGKFMPEYLHGFMFGVVITPTLMMLSDWLPSLFGDGIPELQSDKETETAQQGLMLFYNRLNAERLDGMLTCPFGDHDCTTNDLAAMVKEWCSGFVRAIGLRPEYWIPSKDANGISEFTMSITSIMALSDEKKAVDLLKMSGKKNIASERKKLLEGCLAGITASVEVLLTHGDEHDASYFSDLVLHQPPAHSNKVGRNKPCPCGSGKKFKKCCGAPARSIH